MRLKIIVAIVSVVLVVGTIGLFVFLLNLDFVASEARNGTPYAIQAIMYVLIPGLVLTSVVVFSVSVYRGIMETLDKRGKKVRP